MQVFTQALIFGLGLGAIYALLTQGVILIYRGSGTINFAQGTFAMVGGFLFAELAKDGRVSWPLALLAAVAAGALLGFLTQNPVMWRLREAAPIVRVIATLGIFVVLQAVATIRYQDNFVPVQPYLPQGVWRISTVTIDTSQLILLAIAIVLTFALVAFRKWSLTGLATAAAAESERAAAALAWSPNRLATANWVAGGALAGLAGALTAPISGASVGSFAYLIVPALAAALAGGFSSHFAALGGAVLIGVAQAMCIPYVHAPGVSDALPFLIIIVLMVVRGRALPLRSHVLDRLPSLGTGRINIPAVALVFGAGLVLMLTIFSVEWIDAFTVSFGAGILFLSVVVLTGYAGQISLAQYALAGVGALIAGRLVAAQHWAFVPAAIVGVLGTIVLGLVVALPALRTRGVNLAVVTLGLGFAIQQAVFNNPDITGGATGTEVGSPKIFGLDIGAIVHPERYGAFVLIVFAVASICVANLRRSASGRGLIAIRTNERAAASLGVSVIGTKLYAFAVAAGLAGVAGVVIGFQSPSIIFPDFSVFQSIYALAFTVIGGVGYVLGPLVGSVFVDGGAGSLTNGLFSGITQYIALIGGAVLLLILMVAPDGVVAENILIGRRVLQWWKRRRGARDAPSARHRRAVLQQPDGPVGVTRARVPERTLHVENLSVRFGNVVAVDDVSLKVKPAEIVGLIGPNGAGKTTLIDAITGFVKPSTGTASIDADELLTMSTHKRVRAGLSRSWQSLELFEDVSVLENLLVASDSRRVRDGFRDLIWPGRAKLSEAGGAAIADFGLEDELEMMPGDLPYGRRRLVSLARALSSNPSVLLLDEPFSGLDDSEAREAATLVRRLADNWGMGVLLVEHNVEVVMELCDRICVLDFGAVIAEGPPDEVRQDPAVIHAYLGDVVESEVGPR